MDEKIRQSWERFLNPESLRANLVAGSLFIAAFEMLKSSIIDRIRDFFSTGFNQSGPIIDEKYKTAVLSLNKSALYASLEWLKNMDAINDKDIEEFEKIKRCRNEIAHEFVNFLSAGPTIDPLPLFPTMTALLSKIEKWWILNVEIPTNPDFDGKDIYENGIIPGPIMTLRLLTDIALGSEEESKYYYKFIKEKGVI
jgi:hypothetical protein